MRSLKDIKGVSLDDAIRIQAMDFEMEIIEMQKQRNAGQFMNSVFEVGCVVVLFLAMSGLSGCSSAQVKLSDPADQSYGQTPSDAEAKIKNHFQTTLKDPGSLQIKKLTQPVKATVYKAEEAPHWYDAYADISIAPVNGHKICVTYNAKNSYGVFAGWKSQAFFFSNSGELIPLVSMTREQLDGLKLKGTFSPYSRISFEECAL